METRQVLLEPMNTSEEEWKSVPDGFTFSWLTTKFLTKPKRFLTLFIMYFSVPFNYHPSLFILFSFLKSNVTITSFTWDPYKRKEKNTCMPGTAQCASRDPGVVN